MKELSSARNLNSHECVNYCLHNRRCLTFYSKTSKNKKSSTCTIFSSPEATSNSQNIVKPSDGYDYETFFLMCRSKFKIAVYYY